MGHGVLSYMESALSPFVGIFYEALHIISALNITGMSTKSWVVRWRQSMVEKVASLVKLIDGRTMS